MKNFFILIFSILCVFSFAGCGEKSSGNMKFAASCYPVYIMLLNVIDGVENVEATQMSESHSGCFHDFKLQTSDLKNIESSSAFIINGAGMEIFLDKVLREIPNSKIIDSSKGIELLPQEHEHDHEECEDEDCHHEEWNYHIWLSPDNCIKQVRNIAEGLCAINPKNAEKYKKNADEYINKINDLKALMQEKLINLKGKNVMSVHGAFSYLAKDLGFNIVGVINPDPDSQPGAKELAEILELAKKSNLAAIFTEAQYSDSAAKTVSYAAGTKIYEIDSAVSGDKSKDSYINAMLHNIKVLENIK